MLNRLRDLFAPSAYKISLLIGLAFLVFYAGAQGRLDQVPVLGRAENWMFDLKFKERGPRKPSGDVVVAAVDEKAMQRLGLWPFNRSDVASLIDKIAALGAKAIVFDAAFVDARTEGAFAGAQGLQRRFDQMSLAGTSGTEVLTKLQLAKTDAAGALSAIGTDDRSRDVRTRLEPVAQSLTDALALLQEYRDHNADFAAELAKQSGGNTGDEALGRAVHEHPAVVLGSFALVASEAKELTEAQRAKNLAALNHLHLNSPTPEPPLEKTELTTEGAPVRGVRFPGSWVAAFAAIDPLIEPGKDGTRPSLAFFNTNPDPDAVIRREPLVIAVTPQGVNEPILFPQIDLGAVLKYYDADPGQTRLWVNGSDASQFESVAILRNSAKGLGDAAPQMKDFKRIPVDAQGELLLNYYGKDGTFLNISLADFHDGKVRPEDVAGKIVLFGVTGTATHDQRVTPFSTNSPGVEIHATAIENILHDDYLMRPWWATPFEWTILVFIALLVGLFLTRVRVLRGAFVAVLIAVIYHLFDNILFRNGIAVFSAFPIAEVLTIYIAQTLYRYNTEEKDKNKVRKAFQLYLQPSVIEEMLKNKELPKLGGEKKVLSVMFSDIRGFTTISEKLTPEQLAKLINEYLTPMTNLVFEHGGTLDKYIGDALMAIYGAPVDQPDHALRCARTAVHMMRELAKLQERWRIEGNNYPPIDIGIGVNSGPMVVGNMGGNQRFDYTVLGDNVNLASRLEGVNKEYRSHIIISESTYNMCDGQLAARELGAIRVKGKKEPVKIFELLDDKPAEGDMLVIVETFNAGIAKFRAQQWEEARQQFRKSLELWPNDGPPQAYIEFCNDMEKAPPGADWDGVYTMTHK